MGKIIIKIIFWLQITINQKKRDDKIWNSNSTIIKMNECKVFVFAYVFEIMRKNYRRLGRILLYLAAAADLF